MESRIVWTKTLSQEFWAGIVTPLMFSIAGGLIEERMVRKGLRVAGLKGLEETPFLRLLDGRVYLNAHILEQVVSRVPSFLVTPEVLRFLPEANRERLLRKGVSILSPGFLRILLRVLLTERDWTPLSNYKAFEKETLRIERMGKEWARPDLRGLDESALIDRSRRLYGEMGDYLEIVIWGVLYAYLTRPLIEGLARDWGKDSGGERTAFLRVGLNGVKTFEINREIEWLADALEADPHLKESFESAGTEDIRIRLEREQRSRAFWKGLGSFLEKHGHRFLGRDVCQPTWRERPDAVVEMIWLNRSRDILRETFAEQRRKREEAERVLKTRVAGGALGMPRKAVFSLLLSLDRKYFVLRENMRYFADVYLEQFRRIYLEMGRRWEMGGILERREDVFFLSREEIEELCVRRGHVSSLIAQRRGEYEQALHVETPDVVGGDEALPEPSIPVRQDGLVLRGEVASPGRVIGFARIIREPKDLSNFRKGEILVAHCTDPSWAPVLPLAAGLVLEVGGLLSHGSIVAREYGIPALIRAEGAVERLRDGDPLEVDTDQRCVRVCSSPYPLDNRKQIE